MGRPGRSGGGPGCAPAIAAAGGGSTAFVPVPLAWRATSRQVCGLFPWGSPGQLPLAGAPIGRHQRSRAVVCFDHVSWFRAHRIANPSVLIISKPGLGKSTLSSKLMLWLAALGYVLLIPGPVRGCGRIWSSLPGSPAAVRRGRAVATLRAHASPVAVTGQGGSGFVLRDPDGTQLDLFAAAPGTR